jgi:hypothetical protein
VAEHDVRVSPGLQRHTAAWLICELICSD